MRKIEEAARSYAGRHELWDMPDPEEVDAFLAGARYVLDRLTSEGAINALAYAVEEMDSQDSDATPLEEIATALCAVRKEIEGE